jgi:3-deoxy-D-arabino-heptulosonate 7-phosphate (DAHP) synthase
MRTLLMLQEVRRVEAPCSERDRQAVDEFTARLRKRLKERQDRTEAQRRRVNDPLKH